MSLRSQRTSSFDDMTNFSQVFVLPNLSSNQPGLMSPSSDILTGFFALSALQQIPYPPVYQRVFSAGPAVAL